ncbi:MAG: hypothetical protein M1823_002526 [Watsoniomyces obsoletus]|nr:MAG: hypothetical protein M1823_002526 [Watsoniomyces obsoletus]
MSVAPQRNTDLVDPPVDMETPSASQALDNREDDYQEDRDDGDYEPMTEDEGEEDAMNEQVEEEIGDEEDEEDEEEDVEEEDDEDDDTEGLGPIIAAGNTDAGTEDGEIPGVTRLAREDILEFLGGDQGLGRYLLRYLARETPNGDTNQDEDSDEPVEIRPVEIRIGRRRPPGPKQPTPNIPAEPSEAGQELMFSGNFGTPQAHEENDPTYPSIFTHQLMARELGLSPSGRGHDLDPLMAQVIPPARRVGAEWSADDFVQKMIPSSAADMVIKYPSNCYSGQFSDDGNIFFCCAKDFRVRMYDTSNPYRWKYYKTVHCPHGQWAITDGSLSPDNRFLAFTLMSPNVALVSTDPNDDGGVSLLDLTKSQPGLVNHGYFAIWSIRFSGDGRELVAGASGHSIYVYDLETQQTILRIAGHTQDVNAVCYGDRSSPHLLYSGSDDATLKVWDRRSLADGRAAGVFLGHTEGLTYVDSKGDGRYVLSNGKDQTMKLWDLRRMTSTDRFEEIRPSLPVSHFDYRMDPYDPTGRSPHPHDSSVVTFRGHSVLKTLIRCHFSPPGSSDSRYVYSGSADGSVYIYNLDATLAGKIDVRGAIRKSAVNGLLARARRNVFFTETRVRDVSWHPNAPLIAATAWSGQGTHMGSCSIHSWSDGAKEVESDMPMGYGVDEKLKPV